MECIAEKVISELFERQFVSVEYHFVSNRVLKNTLLMLGEVCSTDLAAVLSTGICRVTFLTITGLD